MKSSLEKPTRLTVNIELTGTHIWAWRFAKTSVVGLRETGIDLEEKLHLPVSSNPERDGGKGAYGLEAPGTLGRAGLCCASVTSASRKLGLSATNRRYYIPIIHTCTNSRNIGICEYDNLLRRQSNGGFLSRSFQPGRPRDPRGHSKATPCQIGPDRVCTKPG